VASFITTDEQRQKNRGFYFPMQAMLPKGCPFHQFNIYLLHRMYLTIADELNSSKQSDVRGEEIEQNKAASDPCLAQNKIELQTEENEHDMSVRPKKKSSVKYTDVIIVQGLSKRQESANRRITLRDVISGNATIEDYIRQLKDEREQVDKEIMPLEEALALSGDCVERMKLKSKLVTAIEDNERMASALRTGLLPTKYFLLPLYKLKYTKNTTVYFYVRMRYYIYTIPTYQVVFLCTIIFKRLALFHNRK